jgi:phosphatidylglycerol:prolipoprotein diacylglycerol transferase
VELFREPDAHLGLLAGMLSMGQALSLPMLALGLCMIWLVQRKQSRQS